MIGQLPSGLPVNLYDTQQRVLGYEHLMKNEPFISRSKQSFPFVQVSLTTVGESLQSQIHRPVQS
jgi:hypothetical protein